MEGTRQSILNQIMAWVTSPQETNAAPRSNTYWFYGSPGIGKTSLAHSICENLHKRKHLAGAFFCRRDDLNLSEPRNILPTLINALAGIFPPFRTIVADRLRNDPI
jgi:Cdc6-like AAA superfamily ATPase